MDLIERTREFVAGVLADEPSSHEMSHIERVESTCMKIQAEEGGDLQVIRLSALLHDVGVVREHREGGDHSVYSAEMARDFLLNEGVDASSVDHVVSCIRTHRFSRGHKAESLEGQILQDSDRIDALGAIGIFRAVMSMGALRCLKHSSGVEKASSKNAYAEDPLDGFAEYMEMKPFKIMERLNTGAAKKIAEDRLKIMHQYLDALEDETSF
ncbi:HD domain-containing protein [Methanococcoides methylutens]|uniref:Metal-dependent phosphohydrolase n=1 Tax=Methanococcoides methylutens MM1 TaxID=1434104 RepID=A0A0E3X109_METMT|nr:HD domain-containing protein [Methanococcoides methylutens]AKB85704.1 metal-dependent phosphohydrolase [Methanococcoides methylutens MM1]